VILSTLVEWISTVVVVERISALLESTTMLIFIPFALMATNSYASTEPPCPEEPSFRFWISISGLFPNNPALTFRAKLAFKLLRDSLVRRGFRTDRNPSPNFVLISCNRARVREIALAVREDLSRLPAGNGTRLTVTAQPSCRDCGTANPFKARQCVRCGSTNITPKGFFDFENDYIVFKRNEKKE
jgi:hypothetical protein